MAARQRIELSAADERRLRALLARIEAAEDRSDKLWREWADLAARLGYAPTARIMQTSRQAVAARVARLRDE